MRRHKQPREPERVMQEANQLPQPSIVDTDPEDPSQLLDDVGQFSVVPLEVEAQPAAESEADVDAAVYETAAEGGELDELATPSQTIADAYVEAPRRDTGDLYGVRTPHATDRQPDTTSDREEFVDSEQGENWLETLGKKAAEYGAEAEEEIVVVDDSD